MESYMVFLSMPSKETISIRGLDKIVPIEFFQARIELEAGLPCDTYELQYGKRSWKGSDIEFDFTRDLRNGAMIKVAPAPLWEDIYFAARTGKANKVLKVCDGEPRKQADTDDEGQFLAEGEEGDEPSRDRKLYFGLCVACCVGATKLVYQLLKLEEAADLVFMQTPFGRSLFHLAAANDKLAILELLGSETHPKDLEDMFGQTPMDIAREVGAIAAQRVLRNLCRPGNRKRTQARRKLTARLEQRRGQNSRSAPPRPHKSTEEPSGFIVTNKDQQEMLSPSIRISYLQKADENQEKTSPRGARWVSSRASSARNSDTSSTVRSSHRPIIVSPSSKQQADSVENMDGRKKTPRDMKALHLKKATSEERAKIQLFKHSRLAMDPKECPSVPCSSPGGSLEDLTNIVVNEDTLHELTENKLPTKEEIQARKQQVRKAYTRPKQTTYRVQSAKYFRSQFHEDDEDATIPKPRPKTAGPRYRQWKIWLLQKMEEDELKAQQMAVDEERMRENAAAFRQWLKNKQTQEDEESEDSDDEDDLYAYAYSPRKDGITFEKWLELRKDQIAKVDAKFKKDRANKGKEKRRQAYDDRKMTIFEFGNTDLGTLRKEDPNNNMRAYQKWADKKRRYELWKKRNGGGDDSDKPARGGRTRSALLLDGMTYDEWLGEKFG